MLCHFSGAKRAHEHARGGKKKEEENKIASEVVYTHS